MALYKSTELTDKTVALLARFKSGELKPIPTGIPHLDDALLGGLLPSTIVGIVGRSQHGKSYDMERIQRNLLNGDDSDNLIFVNCNWELTHFKILVRDITERTGESAKKVLFDPITKESGEQLKKICDLHRTDNVLYQNEPVTADIFEKDIEQVIKDNPDKKIIVAIDNLENILRDKGSQKDCMDALLYKVNVLKNKHSFIAFIILNQMNQNYLLRMDNIKHQRPSESDVYGSDQLTKLCDVLYIKMIPWKLGIKDKFMLFHESQYDWLSDHKLDGTGSKEHFDPYGRAYYFYLKLRQPEDPKNIRDVFVDVMFTKEETGYKETTTSSKKPVHTPNFDTDEDPFETPLKAGNPLDAFGPVSDVKNPPF